jgi:16S rRNA (cytosine967-C5)-methyltransferase
VLLDAPCSATGTIRKNPEIKWRLREEDLPRFAALQRELLAAALELAAEWCVYSTCSLEPEENDAVIGRTFEVVDATPFVPAGARRWVSDGVLRLTPESGADGFTGFVLRRR